mmetsp:Transcript_13888/g.30518  ORF Transcript_13888/g.30518 Transcript_13888/m.30518 type:complete len:82 (+) Transcript_13888:1019-1264(+)
MRKGTFLPSTISPTKRLFLPKLEVVDGTKAEVGNAEDTTKATAAEQDNNCIIFYVIAVRSLISKFENQAIHKFLSRVTDKK